MKPKIETIKTNEIKPKLKPKLKKTNNKQIQIFKLNQNQRKKLK